jgi:hypothetical protein
MLALKLTAAPAAPVTTASRHSSQPNALGPTTSDAANAIHRHFIVRILTSEGDNVKHRILVSS